MNQGRVVLEARRICAAFPGNIEAGSKQLIAGYLDNTSQMRAVKAGILLGYSLGLEGAKL